MKKFAALSMAAVMLTACFVGCGSKDSSDKKDGVKGKWEVSKMVEGDNTYEGEIAPGVNIATYLQLEFKDDNKVSEISATGDNNDGTYTLDGDKVTVEAGGEKVEFKLDGDTMTASEDGMEFTLKKVSEFTTNPKSE
jgi:hypothetical protein